MKTLVSITVVFVAGLILSTGPATADEPGIPKKILKAMERYIGDWEFEGTERDQSVKGTITYRWAPGRHCLLWDMLYISPKGTFLGSATVTWDPAKQQLVERDYWADGSWNTYSYTVKSNVWTGDAVQVDPNGKVAEGRLTEEILGPEEFIWRLFRSESSTEEAAEIAMLHFRKTSSVTAELFQEYGSVMVGDWEGEFVLAGDMPGTGKNGETVKGHGTIAWACDKKGLETQWQFGPVSGRRITFWDPESRQIKVEGFDSAGGVCKGLIYKQEGKWVASITTVYPDGTKRSLTDTLTIVDDGKVHIHSGIVDLNGVRQPNYRDEWKRVMSAGFLTSNAPAQELSKEQMEPWSALEQQIKLIVKRDWDAHRKYMHPRLVEWGPSLPSPIQISKSAEKYFEMVENGRDKVVAYHMVPVSVVVAGDVAIINAYLHVLTKPDDKSVETVYQLHNTWKKEEGRWQLLATYNTIISSDHDDD